MSSQKAARETDRVFWPKPRALPPLRRDEVHVWAATLDRGAPVLKSLWDILSDVEKARAARFYREIDGRRFIASHGVLRVLLGAYLGRRPEDLRFDQNPQGKPCLVDSHEALFFNMAHSEAIALYAVARNREVGIDVECHREDLETEEIAEQFFSPAEVRTLRSIPQHQQKEAFFNCWTRKEAFVKAIGQGLSTELDQFEVAFAPGLKPAILRTVWDPGEASRWNLVGLQVNPFYSAALVTQKHNVKLSCWTWNL